MTWMVDPDMPKTCSKCRLVKPRARFSRCPHRKDGLRPQCKDCSAASNRLRRENNLDHVHALEAATRVRNAATLKAYAKVKTVRTRAAIRAGLRPPLRRDLLKRAVHEIARRARKRAAGGEFTADDVGDIAKLQKGRCANPACKIKLHGKYHIDHIVPFALGGRNDRRNIQLLCPGCNMTKGAKHPIVFAQQFGLLI